MSKSQNTGLLTDRRLFEELETLVKIGKQIVLHEANPISRVRIEYSCKDDVTFWRKHSLLASRVTKLPLLVLLLMTCHVPE